MPKNITRRQDSAHGQEDKFSLGRLSNLTNTAEGSALPPRQRGPFRVPFVSSLAVVNTTAAFGQTVFTLTWLEPPASDGIISHYNIYVINLVNNNQPPIGPYTCQGSPANISIPAQNSTNVTFIVQTVLTNGYVSDLDSSPTTTGITISTDGAVDVTSIANGTPGQIISWSASGVATAFGPGAANNFLVGAGAGALPQFKSAATLGLADLVKGASAITTIGQIPYAAGTAGTLGTIAAGATDTFLVGAGAAAPVFKSASTLDLIIGRSNLTTAGAVPYVSASGTLNQDATKLFWDSANHRLGIGNAAPNVPLEVTGANTSAETIRVTGLVKFAGSNATGAGSAALGANCPAVTVTAPYVWVKCVSDDGSTVYIPAFK